MPETEPQVTVCTNCQGIVVLADRIVTAGIDIFYCETCRNHTWVRTRSVGGPSPGPNK